jgi:hypothetical protein
MKLMEVMDYAPRTRNRQVMKPVKKPIKKNKVKTAATVTKAVLTGICEGFIPYAVIAGDNSPWLYAIPFAPVVIYLITRVIKDLKGWYENEEM